jgi:hypothetical protein
MEKGINMNRQKLLVRLEIAKAELEDNVHNEQGCFDEIAQRIFAFALSSGLLQEKSSEDVEIQLDKSVHIIHCDEQEYIDGIYLSGTTTEVYFTASSFDGSEIYCYDIEDIEREDVVKVVKELIKMCKMAVVF